MGKNNTPKPLPSKEALLSRLAYDSDTGLITWKAAPPRWNPNGPRANRKRVYTLDGKPAGSVRKMACNKSYLAIRIFGDLYQAHRLIWMMHHGVDPGEKSIDHINGDGLDNRICNLRIATHKENMANMSRSQKNEAGYIGVRKYGNRYRSSIRIDGKNVYVHGFDTAESAAAHRDKMAARHRGDFAKLNFESV